MRGIVAIAGKRDLWLMAHSDAAAIERLFEFNPKAKIVWAHTGMGEPVEVVKRLFDQYPALVESCPIARALRAETTSPLSGASCWCAIPNVSCTGRTPGHLRAGPRCQRSQRPCAAGLLICQKTWQRTSRSAMGSACSASNADRPTVREQRGCAEAGEAVQIQV